MGDSIPVGETTITVRDPGVERFLLEEFSGHPRVRSDAEEKYLTVRVTFPDLPSPLRPENLTLVTDAGRYQPLENELASSEFQALGAAFLLPADQSVQAARIEVRDGDGQPLGRWRCGEGLLRRLNEPPVIEVSNVTVPEAVSCDESVFVTFGLQNRGPVDGTFRYALGTADQSRLVPDSVSVPAGAKLSHEDSAGTAASGSVAVVVDYGRTELSRTVDVSE